MSIDHHLYRARAALSCLEHLACYYSEEADAPPADFGFGLSIIFDYIKDDVTAAYNGLIGLGLEAYRKQYRQEETPDITPERIRELSEDYEEAMRPLRFREWEQTP